MVEAGEVVDYILSLYINTSPKVQFHTNSLAFSCLNTRKIRAFMSRYEQDLVGERGKGRQAMAVAGSVTSLRGLPYSVYYD